MGAILTFAQSWYVQGVTLGSLLHSVALAGEATRVAVVDWNRSSRGATDSTVDATDTIDATSGRKRALSEVTSAVANESQEGFPLVKVGIVARLQYSYRRRCRQRSLWWFRWGFESWGTSTVSSDLTVSAESSGWSTGHRDITAELTQSVAESTEQHATSVRNRRATTVQEVSDSESEEISHRIVANYNHMHALTIQYWEVVQTYRVDVQLRRPNSSPFCAS